MEGGGEDVSGAWTLGRGGVEGGREGGREGPTYILYIGYGIGLLVSAACAHVPLVQKERDCGLDGHCHQDSEDGGTESTLEARDGVLFGPGGREGEREGEGG